jgi:isocitrate lyase
MGVPTLLIARTDADSATLLTSDVDERDQRFITGERTPEGFFQVATGSSRHRARPRLRPYADLLWMETSKPDLDEARRFAEAVHAEFPGKMLAYNCSPSFNWKKHLDEDTIAKFQRELGAMGFKFQFITLAGFHALNYSMFELASGYREAGCSAYSELQEAEFAAEADGYTATKHQREVGTGYFDRLHRASPVLIGRSSTQRSSTALVDGAQLGLHDGRHDATKPAAPSRCGGLRAPSGRGVSRRPSSQPRGRRRSRSDR